MDPDTDPHFGPHTNSDPQIFPTLDPDPKQWVPVLKINLQEKVPIFAMHVSVSSFFM